MLKKYDMINQFDFYSCDICRLNNYIDFFFINHININKTYLFKTASLLCLLFVYNLFLRFYSANTFYFLSNIIHENTFK